MDSATLDGFLTCQICYDRYNLGGDESNASRIPKMLNCHHYYCAQCLNGMVERSGYDDEEIIRCPYCRCLTNVTNTVENLSNNFMIHEMLSITTKSSKKDSHNVICGNCGITESKIAEWFCENCLSEDSIGVPMCSLCYEVHLKLRLLSSHTIVPISKYLENPRLKKKIDLCPTHNLNIDYYCGSCQESLCHKCAILYNHINHEIIDIKTESESRLNEMTNIRKKLDDYLNRLNNALLYVQDLLSNYTITETSLQDTIESDFDHLFHLLQLKRDSIREQLKLNSLHDSNHSKILLYENDIKLNIKEITNYNNILYQTISSGTDKDICECLNEVRHHIQSRLIICDEELRKLENNQLRESNLVLSKNYYHFIDNAKELLKHNNNNNSYYIQISNDNNMTELDDDHNAMATSTAPNNTIRNHHNKLLFDDMKNDLYIEEEAEEVGGEEEDINEYIESSLRHTHIHRFSERKERDDDVRERDRHDDKESLSIYDFDGMELLREYDHDVGGAHPCHHHKFYWDIKANGFVLICNSKCHAVTLSPLSCTPVIPGNPMIRNPSINDNNNNNNDNKSTLAKLRMSTISATQKKIFRCNHALESTDIIPIQHIIKIYSKYCTNNTLDIYHPNNSLILDAYELLEVYFSYSNEKVAETIWQVSNNKIGLSLKYLKYLDDQYEFNNNENELLDSLMNKSNNESSSLISTTVVSANAAMTTTTNNNITITNNNYQRYGHNRSYEIEYRLCDLLWSSIPPKKIHEPSYDELNISKNIGYCGFTTLVNNKKDHSGVAYFEQLALHWNEIERSGRNKVVRPDNIIPVKAQCPVLTMEEAVVCQKIGFEGLTNDYSGRHYFHSLCKKWDLISREVLAKEEKLERENTRCHDISLPDHVCRSSAKEFRTVISYEGDKKVIWHEIPLLDEPLSSRMPNGKEWKNYYNAVNEDMLKCSQPLSWTDETKLYARLLQIAKKLMKNSYYSRNREPYGIVARIKLMLRNLSYNAARLSYLADPCKGTISILRIYTTLILTCTSWCLTMFVFLSISK